MRLGIRLLFAFFLINGLAAFFVLRVFMAEIKPSVRKVTEDTLVETAYLLAAQASDDLADGKLGSDSGSSNSRFAQHVQAAFQQPLRVWIWDTRKAALDLRVTVTNGQGRVLFDSAGQDVGADYARWRNVALTLRGEYGARTSREVATDEATSVMYVSAPIARDGAILGVLTVSKPANAVQSIIDSSERKMLRGGVLFLLLSAAVGFAITWWLVVQVRKLRSYAQHVQGPTLQEAQGKLLPPKTPEVPDVPGELGDLAQAMDSMRRRLEGRDYIEGYVRALTHELKSPVAAIRGAGELLQDDLPAADRAMFAQQVVDQSLRLQNLIDQLMQLSQLEQRNGLAQAGTPTSLRACAAQAIAQLQATAAQKGIQLQLQGGDSQGAWDAALVTLAISNLLANALDFSPAHSQIVLTLEPQRLSVQDSGPGVPDSLLHRLGERFFTTPRPNGERSGTGLGLSIVQRIMLLHGGRLQFANTHPGLRASLDFSAQG
ncbi:two-component system sensor histidine kinase CreC [Comamonas sp.]|uniref:two-component system sensor histidine kinase CreC n=1 Tax=Comamonas sp. TaxID=34028 RepID=UPI00289EB452|nr:two-component system sensor histidine kinase CreC [Comamonas sp.]